MKSMNFSSKSAAATKVLTSSLYHYTSSDAAILGILANRSIRMSPFQGTNDLWESRPLLPNLEGNLSHGESTHGDVFSILWEDIIRYIRGYSKVACFTQDWALPDSVMQPDTLRGWAHLSLWAHYGAGHTGVCLRFDRDRLVAAFEAARENAIHQFHGPVRYRRAEYGVGPHGIANLEQAEEFGNSMPSRFDTHTFIATESFSASTPIGPVSPNLDWSEQTCPPNRTILTSLTPSLASCWEMHSRTIGFRPCSRC